MELAASYGRQFKASWKNLMSGNALRAKAMRGGAWLGGASVAEQAIRFARNMVLARLLAPGAFGTMAIVLSSAFLVDAFIDVGVRVAVIQSSDGGREAHLNAAWWLGLGRALLSYLIVFGLAPFIASFYGRPELCALLRISLLSVVLSGLMSPRSALAQREMKLGRWTAIYNGGAICGVILTVVLSILMHNVWALAIGYCCENAFRTILSFALCPGLPSFSVDWSAVKQLLNFSRGMFGLAILNLVINRADIFVLGRLYPLTALGLYTMAVSLVNTPASFLSNMLAQTLLPAMSSIQADLSRVNRILIEVNTWLFFGLPAAVLFCLSAPVVLRLAYGTRYVAAAGPLSVATAVVFFTVLNVAPSCALFAKGLPDIHRRAVVVSAVTMLVFVYPASLFLGPIGAQVAALLASLGGYGLQILYLHRATNLSFAKYGSTSILPVVASGVMLGIVLVCRKAHLTNTPAADITMCIVSCLVAYAICAFGYQRISRRPNEHIESAPPESAVIS
jgi:O-antigen/teichoic acid export membrane protein